MSDFEDKVKKLFDTQDDTALFDPMDIEQSKMIALFSYLSWLVLIPILVAPNSPYARFHANQGIVLAIAEAIISVLVTVMSFMPLVGWIFLILSAIISLFCFALTIFGIVNAVNGRAKRLPITGHIILIK